MPDGYERRDVAMCEYCGCQDIPVIDELTREHDHVVNLIGGVRAAHAAGDVAELARMAGEIRRLLEPHTEVEEGGLFPALADEFPEHIGILEAEHRQIASVLDEAADAVPADPAWPNRLLSTMSMLREHILREQDGVFPAALASLDSSDWEAMEKIRERVGSGLPSHVH